jgi:pimeloyl-ACP methyl ester carboxylesterase
MKRDLTLVSLLLVTFVLCGAAAFAVAETGAVAFAAAGGTGRAALERTACAAPLTLPLTTAPEKTLAAAKQLTTLSPDSIPISYTVQGKGEPALVFVHCWSCDQSYWKDEVPYFDKKYTVVTLDLAGHGRSGLGRKDWTIQSFGGDVAAVVKALDLKHVILIGHSMGGAVCLEAARLMPDRVIGIVGVDTFQDFGMKIPEEQRKAFLAAFQANFPATTTQFVKRMFPVTADTALAGEVAADMASEPHDVAIGAMRNLLSYDYAAALKGLEIPIRCINSDAPPTNVEGNKKLAYSFDVKYMPGHGHFLFLEDPATFKKLLDETVQELAKRK